MRSFILGMVLGVLFIFGATTLSHAATYVIVNSQTKEVVSVSPQDDAVVGQNQEKIILDKDYVDLGDVTNYKLINKKFVENIQKISDKENAILKSKARSEEEAKINLEMKRQAYEALKAKGEKFTEIKDEDFK